MSIGPAELAITEPPPDPAVETVELLEMPCREVLECELATLVGDR